MARARLVHYSVAAKYGQNLRQVDAKDLRASGAPENVAENGSRWTSGWRTIWDYHEFVKRLAFVGSSSTDSIVPSILRWPLLARAWGDAGILEMTERGFRGHARVGSDDLLNHTIHTDLLRFPTNNGEEHAWALVSSKPAEPRAGLATGRQTDRQADMQGLRWVKWRLPAVSLVGCLPACLQASNEAIYLLV